ncbi:GntR family transcriptional regulator [Sciscionella marina]|uniref:GntR family transcriptional regulator n=1 Tax=Sciscionella marina TaxID=508770 RepID=UPI00058FA767|nr:FCD domain-containing protein [Sciscionella marina]
MVKNGDGSTRTNFVYAAIRADILGGRLVPGERLKFPVLSQRYETSVGAAREALIRLLGEGLVKNQDHHGYTVTPLSHRELVDLTDARVEIESLVLRMSVESGGVEWESRLLAAHHVLERAPFFADGDIDHPGDQWSAAHAAFHLALIDACPNQHLLDVACALREEAELYRQWSVSFGQEPDRNLPAEHAALRDAALAKEPELAGRLIREHIAHTANLLISCAVDDPPASNSA